MVRRIAIAFDYSPRWKQIVVGGKGDILPAPSPRRRECVCFEKEKKKEVHHKRRASRASARRGIASFRSSAKDYRFAYAAAVVGEGEKV